MSPSYITEAISFHHGHNVLSGCLCLPDTAGKHPAIVFVMGSGPADRSGYSSLPPLWEAFAVCGIASLAWDKPGVGLSTGDWRFQSNMVRASEVAAAITFAEEHPHLDPSRIGMWGISQAGWVMPLVFTLKRHVKALIAVSLPVGIGAEQELYRVAHTLPADGFTASEVQNALEFTRKRLQMIHDRQPFSELDALQRSMPER